MNNKELIDKIQDDISDMQKTQSEYLKIRIENNTVTDVDYLCDGAIGATYRNLQAYLTNLSKELEYWKLIGEKTG